MEQDFETAVAISSLQGRDMLLQITKRTGFEMDDVLDAPTKKLNSVWGRISSWVSKPAPLSEPALGAGEQHVLLNLSHWLLCLCFACFGHLLEVSPWALYALHALQMVCLTSRWCGQYLFLSDTCDEWYWNIWNVHKHSFQPKSAVWKFNGCSASGQCQVRLLPQNLVLTVSSASRPPAIGQSKTDCDKSLVFGLHHLNDV